GIVHRDIKPDNILLSGDASSEGGAAGRPPSARVHALVADFGIAKALDAAGGEKLTQTGLSLGTPAYMSPEQGTASRVDARTDVYSLGCVLYEMLAGDPPFTGATARSVMARHAMDPVPAIRTARPTVPAHIEQAIIRALAKVPADRFATVAEFAAALDDSGVTAIALPTRAHPAGRRSLRVVGVGIAVLAIVGAIVARLWPAPEPAPDMSLVAVVPFRVASADTSLRYLHEGLVDLFAAKLNGEAGPRSVDPRAVMRLWNDQAEGRDDLPENEALLLAGTLKAGRMLTGSVVGASGRLVLSASMVDVATGRVRQQATVDGLHDSLPYLVDRLAGQLLALGAGVQSRQLTSLTSASLPALRAYLTGRSAARAGRWADAIERFDHAVKTDTAFALAGLGLASASSWLDGSGSERGMNLAWAARERLSWRDRTLLEATRKDDLKSLEEVVTKIPDSPEAWFQLGDKYYHNGALHGVIDADARALDAFRRALALDPATATNPNAEPLAHFGDLALAAGDSATVRHLLSLALAQDSTGEFSEPQQLALARARGDTAAIARWYARLDRAKNFQTLLSVIWGGQQSGEHVRDAQRAVDIVRRRVEQDPEYREVSDVILLLAHDLALNRGRPAEADGILESFHPRVRPRARIANALYWGGDTAAASEAARQSAKVVAGPTPPVTDTVLHAYFYDVCALEQWRLAQGNSSTAPTAIARLRAAARIPGIQFPEEHERCADLLSAWHATATRRPDARVQLARVDSIQARNPVGVVASPIIASNLLVARLWEEHGDWARAEAATRRRYTTLMPRFLSTYLREEGRTAALAGHRDAAIQAYQHYLALRYDPEPSVKPEVDQVRNELAALVGEQ
ncbi:MAG: protein kinase, partial [Gemmatimonadota bacterium]|nr:protein kinase [Gemmatimonadota bacterium]